MSNNGGLEYNTKENAKKDHVSLGHSWVDAFLLSLGSNVDILFVYWKNGYTFQFFRGVPYKIGQKGTVSVMKR